MRAAQLKQLEDLYKHELSDLLSAENQLVAALPKIADQATSEGLKKSIQTHLEQTEAQRDRITKVFEMLGQEAESVECKAMKGILQEGTKVIGDSQEGALRDVAIIGAAAKVEHYEISSYDSAIAMAEALGHDDQVELLMQTRNEEAATAKKLMTMAESEELPKAGGKDPKKAAKTGMNSKQNQSGDDDEETNSRARNGARDKENTTMRTSDRERDQYGRFTSDDDDRGGRGRGRDDYNERGQNRDRDSQGRFMSDDRGGGGGRGRNDDDDRGGGRGRGGDGRGWYGDSEGHSQAARQGWDDRDNGGRGGSNCGRDDDYRGSSSRGGYDDDRGGGRGRGDDGRGWYGDSQGHSEAARRGWDNRDDDRGGSNRGGGGGYSRSRDDDDDRGGRGRGGDDGRGWYGDSQGHSEAARRGWDNRDDDRGGSNRGGNGGGYSRSRDDDDYRGGSNRGGGGGSSRGRDGDDDRGGRGNGQGGWFGDSQGHSEAARRGWENRDDDRGGSSRGGGSNRGGGGGNSRGRDDDDDRGSSNRGSGSNRGGDDGRGWHGDSRGHAEAARKGWENRDR